MDLIGLVRTKKKIALALAEKLHGSQEHFISMDLSSQDGMINSNTIFGLWGMNGYDIKFRGKTLVDCLAEELTKKPLSIAFLENVDKADVLTQNSGWLRFDFKGDSRLREKHAIVMWALFKWDCN